MLTMLSLSLSHRKTFPAKTHTEWCRKHALQNYNNKYPFAQKITRQVKYEHAWLFSQKQNKYKQARNEWQKQHCKRNCTVALVILDLNFNTHSFYEVIHEIFWSNSKICDNIQIHGHLSQGRSKGWSKKSGLAFDCLTLLVE